MMARMKTTLLFLAILSAQDIRRDSVWDGTVIGAAAGAGVGALTGALTEDICSAVDCAVFGAVAGAALGRVIDKHIGARRAVQPGTLVDDRLWNGALIGGAVGVGVVAIDLKRNCNKPPNNGPCTPGGVARNLIRGLWWTAAIGALVDAAIPTKTPSAGRGVALQMRVHF